MSLNGTERFLNNSVINKTEMGVNTSLFCLTSNNDCCEYSGNENNDFPLRTWILPNGVEIAGRSSHKSQSFSVSRGPNAVLLHRDNELISHNGIFTCVIPNDRNITQRLFIGIYQQSEGMNVSFIQVVLQHV